MVNGRFATGIIEQLDGWVNDLAAPLMPRRMVAECDDFIRLESRQHIPHCVIIGMAVRAVSGLRAALALAGLGYTSSPLSFDKSPVIKFSAKTCHCEDLEFPC